jgi:hypothetical protein
MLTSAARPTTYADTSPEVARSTNVIHRCGPALPAFTRPTTHRSVRPHIGDNSVDTPVSHTNQGCGRPGDNRCMTGPRLGLTRCLPDLRCGRTEPLHRSAELSTAGIHLSYTGQPGRHLRKRGWSTESTGPTTTMRPRTMDPAPSTWGKVQPLITPEKEPRRTTDQVLAGGPCGIRVRAHLRVHLSSHMFVEGRVTGEVSG